MKTPEEINRMTSEQLRERLRAIRCFMLDMDGTFYLGSQILPGSLEFLDAVEQTGRQVLFLTNNSSKSADHYIQKLRGMNVREPFLNILTSGQAAARYCLEHFAGKKAFLLGNHILAAEFEKFGVPVRRRALRPALYRDASRLQLPHGNRLHSRHRRDHRLHQGQHGPRA